MMSEMPEIPARRSSVEAVWCELYAPDRVSEALPVVAAQGLALHLAWKPELELELFAVARRAQALGVEVRPWLLLDRAEGYWPSAKNAHVFAEAARSLLRTWAREVGTRAALIVDMEPPFETTLRLDALIKGDLRDPKSMLRALRSLLSLGDDARYDDAQVVFRQLVDGAHAEGARVMLTTLPIVVDDREGALMRALGLVVDGVAWDRVSLQAYRTVFQGLLPSWLGERAFSSHLISSYAEAVRARFGERGGLDLGLVGHGVVPAPLYESPRSLQDDIAAAEAAGVPGDRLAVFNLEGLIERGPMERWLAKGEARQGKPVMAPKADLGTRPLRAMLRGVGWALRRL